LLVQVVEIAEGAGQEEVLADIAERSLDLALGFGAIRSAGSGLEAIMLRQPSSDKDFRGNMLVTVQRA
jgi:hypothetical protein